MDQELFSVDQVAERLGLHVKTVRGYIKDGRLKAVRIGKQYRIARSDLEALTGRPVPGTARETAGRHRRVDVSGVVQVDAISRESADRVTTMVTAGAGGGHREDDQPLWVQATYDEERASLKLILVGGPASTAKVLQLIDLLNEEMRP